MESFQAVLPRLDYASILWIGAVSFEQRCLGSVYSLSGQRNVKALAVNYTTRLHPADRGERLRGRWRRELGRQFAALGDKAEVLTVHPYSPKSLRTAIDEFLKLADKKVPLQESAIILDLTCLTKIHAVYSLIWLLQQPRVARFWAAYTTPADYGAPKQLRTAQTRGWSGVVQCPVYLGPKECAPDASNTVGYAVLITGHEGHRMHVARAQLTCDFVDLVLATNAITPILETKARRENTYLLQEILRNSPFGWKILECDRLDSSALETLIYQRLQNLKEAQNVKVQGYLAPLGPKPMLAAAVSAFWHARECDLELVYPIPLSYDVDVTQGIDKVYWSRIK